MIKVAQGHLGKEELLAVQEAFDYGYFGHAHDTERFEQELARFLNINEKNVVAVANGTDALHIALICAGIKEGDEVLVPSMTFVATYQAISAIGATPVSCDVLESNLLIDLEDAAKRITKRTKAIIPVHYSGNPCNMDKVVQFAQKYNLRVVEDAAHAFGCDYCGQKIGSFGDITCFSFDSIKIITCGEGGAVVSSDIDLISQIKVARMLGMDKSQKRTISEQNIQLQYDVVTQGYRYHMSNINAAIGLEQLKKINVFIERRREICAMYVDGLKGINGIHFLDIDYQKVTPFMFVIRVLNSKRDLLSEYLRKNDIETGIKYPPAHLFTMYYNEKMKLPVAEKAYLEILELPLHCKLSNEDVAKVIAAITVYFNGGK